MPRCRCPHCERVVRFKGGQPFRGVVCAGCGTAFTPRPLPRRIALDAALFLAGGTALAFLVWAALAAFWRRP
jgi:hypothetical protein